MGIQTYTVSLPLIEKEHLQLLIHAGTAKVRTIYRAQVLLLADEGKKDKEIYSALHLAKTTPYDVRKRYHTGGLKRALYDLPRPGQKRKLTGVQEAEVIATACSQAPRGADRWTLDLLTEAVNRKGILIGRTAIHKVLLRSKTKPWRKKNVGHSQSHASVY